MHRLAWIHNNFYPRPPRGGRPGLAGERSGLFIISIHALREEGDLCQWFCTHSCVISIHALREEGDLPLYTTLLTSTRFLSTPSARRATWINGHIAQGQLDFYPRPPRGGRPGRVPILSPRRQISIHALREEGDPKTGKWELVLDDFYPRPPRGGRPAADGGGQKMSKISIHALREEGDQTVSIVRHANKNFYPRPPRGGRLTSELSSVTCPYFYPRPPRGGRL